MARKLGNAVEGPKEGNAKGTRKRTKSVEIELSRLKNVIEEKPQKAEKLLVESEKEISSKEYEVSPMALVIAANATVLQRFDDGEDEAAPYEESIEEKIKDPVKLIMAGMLVDLEHLLKNYKCEIDVLETSRRKRMKYLFNEIPGMAMQLRPAARWGASVFTGVSFWGAMYLALRNAIGDIYAVMAGAAIAGAAFYITSKKFGEFVSNTVIRFDDWLTRKWKKRTCRKYSEEKVAKLKTMAKALQQEMSTGKKQFEIDYETIEEIGKTMPSPFEIKEN
jgi:hypothetical protein